MPANPAPIDSLLASAEHSARMCGRSRASWWRDHAAGRVPAPVKIGGATLWRVEELRAWIAAGCPTRKVWQQLQGFRKGGAR